MITVTILTKNCQETLPATLDSVKKFSEVLVFDTGSTDDTLKIAKSYANVKIYHGDFLGFGPSHNAASSLAQSKWILSIDSDEVLSPALADEILALRLNSGCVYLLNRQNYFNGKWIKGCGGWHPDPVGRLYDRSHTRFTDDAVHEKVITDGLSVHTLSSPLCHYPYRKMSDFLSKMEKYTTLFAEQNADKKRGSLFKAIAHGWFAFLKSYLLKRGFLNGQEGFIISAYNGHTAFYKYLKLMEKNKPLCRKNKEA